jgi:hypothetical protein
MGKYGVQCRRVGGRLDGPCHDLAIMAYLVPKQWQLRGWGRSSWPWRPQAGLRGLLTTIRTGYSGRRGDIPFLRALRRRSGCNSARRGAASTGAAAQGQQWRGWRPAGLASRPGPVSSRESSSRVWPAPLRGYGALAVRE